jgi:hypothetical protein
LTPAPYCDINELAMLRRAPIRTLSVAGLLILLLLGGTVFGHAAAFGLAFYLPATLLPLTAPQPAGWRLSEEPRNAALETVLSPCPGRAPPFFSA